MIRKYILFSLLSTFLFSSNIIYEDDKIYRKTINESNFENQVLFLKDEINSVGFVIVYELDIAKSTNNIAKELNEKEVLKKGKKIGFCKSSYALKMLKENFHNINFCPLNIAIYQNEKESIYISFLKNRVLSENESIALEINSMIKNIIDRVE